MNIWCHKTLTLFDFYKQRRKPLTCLSNRNARAEYLVSRAIGGRGPARDAPEMQMGEECCVAQWQILHGALRNL